MAGSIFLTESLGDMVKVTTDPCVVCGKQNVLVVDREGFKAWQAGQLIQNALPELSPAERELLISGTCDECFNQMFPPEGEE